MSQRRASWTPGQGDAGKKSGPKTTMVRADGVRRVERKPIPRSNEPQVEEAPVAVAGSGRGLPISAGPAPEQADGGPAPVVPGGPSPFSGYAPTAKDLAHGAAAGAESSNQITAIVLGMGFVFSMITILVMVILAAGLFVWSQKNQNDGLADGEEGQGHIRDTAVAPEIIKRKERGGGGGGAGSADPGDGGDAAPAAPTTGPVTVTVPEHVFFHSMEINCPEANIRRRAKFRGRKASTTGVPLHEECILTFQGSQPATARVSGDQVLDCVTFNPTECRIL